MRVTAEREINENVKDYVSDLSEIEIICMQLQIYVCRRNLITVIIKYF